MDNLLPGLREWWQGGAMAYNTQLTGDVRRCIQDCLDCERICVETVNYCLVMGGKHAEAYHIRTLLDCAEICATAAGFMLRGSDYQARTCGVCAELCAACAESCQNVGPHDQTMQECAEVCRRCASSCRTMAGRAA
jgi:hypothetical protein